MIELTVAAAFFVGIHLAVSGTRLRDLLVAKVGERPYQALFSLASLAGLAWMARAYRPAGHVDLWGQLHYLAPAMLVLAAIAVLLVVVGLTTPGPTTVGAESLLRRDDPARGIHRVTRHPFLWGVSLWALGHLVVNGDLASFILFGSLLILALAGTRSIDAKRRRAFGADWERYAAATSNVPFAAIAAGRSRLRLREVGWWRVAVAAAVYAAILYFHQTLFGVSPLA